MIDSHKNNPASATTKGPVDNLENYLQPDWWKRVFNSMYLKTDADVVEDQQITKEEVDRIVELLGMHPGDALLDLACGQGRHLFELADRGYSNLQGLDRSRYLIQKARNQVKAYGLKINFKEGDARKLPYPNDSFNYVTIMGNSFGYFESTDDDLKVLSEVRRVLRPGGMLLMDVADGTWLKEHFVPRGWEWLDKKHFVCRERSLSADTERLVSREVVTHIEKGVIVDQFYAERLYSEDTLTGLLREANFEAIKVHGPVHGNSQRNQDLGMMERRMILSGTVLKEWSPRKKAKDVKNVVVLLGDPKMRDKVKPDAIFDEDDFHTIQQLKVALSQLQGYKFHYLNNHNTLIGDLEKLKDKIDLALNLCDEGYYNEASKELHVPSLLEILRIPYTGSNPQNLAYCYDKSLIRGIAAEIDIPVADAFFIKPEDNLYELYIPFPVIAKPNFGDSSFGITQKNVAYSINELDEAILRIRSQFGYDKPILVEEFLTGAEITVGILGNTPADYIVLPIIEEDFSQLPDHLPKICGYEAKWLTDSPYYKSLRSIPASLPADVSERVITNCLKLFDRLDCHDYCRFDWRLGADGQPRLLEVNPNPGWCWDGHLAKMAAIGGKDYASMLETILKACEKRIGNSQEMPKRQDVELYI